MARPIALALAVVCSAALAARASDQGEFLRLSAIRDGTTTVHEYSVEPFGDPNYRRITRLVVETKGAKPVALRSPKGWVATLIASKRKGLWGCEWRSEWKVSADRVATLPVSGFAIVFPGAAPGSWCTAELDGNGMEMFRTGPEAGVPGVP